MVKIRENDWIKIKNVKKSVFAKKISKSLSLIFKRKSKKTYNKMKTFDAISKYRYEIFQKLLAY